VTTPDNATYPDLAIPELLIRYERGEFSASVRERLALIFREDPPDAWQRLEKACKYLGITGADILECEKCGRPGVKND
jgi:hypothetical protein